jgi:hypothetical protein
MSTNRPKPPGDPDRRGLPIGALIGIVILALIGLAMLAYSLNSIFGGAPAAPAAPSAAAQVSATPTQPILIPTTTPVPPTEAPSATPLPASPTLDTTAATAGPTATLPSGGSASGDLNVRVVQANIRSGPGLDFPIIGTIDGGQSADVIGRTEAGDWLAISFNGATGWVSIQVADYIGDDATLPVLQGPAAPPATAAATATRAATGATAAPTQTQAAGVATSTAPAATATAAAGATSPPAATSAPTQVPPTQPPASAGSPIATGSGTRGITGRLEIDSGRLQYAANERIWFFETIQNTTGSAIQYGIIGVQARNTANGTSQFQTSWSALTGPRQIDANCTGPTDRCGGTWRDGMNISSTGTYELRLSICYNLTIQECQSAGAQWEYLTGPIVITVS